MKKGLFGPHFWWLESSRLGSCIWWEPHAALTHGIKPKGSVDQVHRDHKAREKARRPDSTQSYRNSCIPCKRENTPSRGRALIFPRGIHHSNPTISPHLPILPHWGSNFNRSFPGDGLHPNHSKMCDPIFLKCLYFAKESPPPSLAPS